MLTPGNYNSMMVLTDSHYRCAPINTTTTTDVEWDRIVFKQSNVSLTMIARLAINAMKHSWCLVLVQSEIRSTTDLYVLLTARSNLARRLAYYDES